MMLFLLLSVQLYGCSNQLPDNKETVQPVAGLLVVEESAPNEIQMPVEKIPEDNAALSPEEENTPKSANDADKEKAKDAPQPEVNKTTTDNNYYKIATTISSAEVEQYAVQVRQQFLEQDWAAISSEISYPITISDTTYESSADFLNASDSFEGNLNDAFLSALELESCVEMFCNYQGIMIGETGQIWIGEVANGDSTSRELKIVAINDLLK